MAEATVDDRPGTASRLAFHGSRIVIDLGVLIALGSMSLPFVTSPAGDRNAIEADALPALLLLIPVFLITLIPDHAWPIPKPLGWVALLLGAAAFPYALVKRFDAALLADTLGGEVGTGATLLVVGTVVVLVGIVYGLVRAALGMQSGGSPTRTARIPRGRVAPAPTAAEPAPRTATKVAPVVQAPAAPAAPRPAPDAEPGAPASTGSEPPTASEPESSEDAATPRRSPATPSPATPPPAPEPTEPPTEPRHDAQPAGGSSKPSDGADDAGTGDEPPSEAADRPSVAAPRARRPDLGAPAPRPAPPAAAARDEDDGSDEEEDPELVGIDLELADIPTIEATDEVQRVTTDEPDDTSGDDGREDR